MECVKTVCPLLHDPVNYNPDTIDLLNDSKERTYWLLCFKEMVRKFINKAAVINPNNPEATKIAEQCFQCFHELVEQLLDDPTVLKPLSVRTILEFNEVTLRKYNFKDAWFNQKQLETSAALKEFKARIDMIDKIADLQLRWLEVVYGILAGNMFDWGAKAVSEILESGVDFGLDKAKAKIQQRPWFRDSFDLWVEKIEKSPYRKAVVFVDNAGIDFVLGMLPFIRELLKLHTQVILSANTFPSLNDITHSELLDCLKLAGNDCPIIRNSLDRKQLLAIENGQAGPCLDLSNLNQDLCVVIKNADLIVLEGMARSVHTNLNAKFNVDSLKMAVLKNEWLANSFGTTQFSVIFEFIEVTNHCYS